LDNQSKSVGNYLNACRVLDNMICTTQRLTPYDSFNLLGKVKILNNQVFSQMGDCCSKKAESEQLCEIVDLSHFVFLRSIGRGTFGKVCIVKKKDTDKLYAMKYMNKKACLEKAAVDNVCREQQILMALRHPFLVNLWYTFQDQEDLFMVVELFQGGDLRFHIDNKSVTFDKHTLKIYALEIGLALDYLRSKGVIHRDIKPENILLDDNGHLALTDFNVAAICAPEKRLQGISGTRMYMAPEMFEASFRKSKSYSFEVDWWSTGVSLFEVYTRSLPYDYTNLNRFQDCYNAIKSKQLKMPSESWDPAFAEVIKGLLEVNPKNRISSCEDLNKLSFFGSMKKEEVFNKLVRPTHIPCNKKVNCDPTFELEEMIIEDEPLRKKKKRLSELGHENEAPDTTFNKFVNFDRVRDWNQETQLFENEILKHDPTSSNKSNLPVTPDPEVKEQNSGQEEEDAA